MGGADAAAAPSASSTSISSSSLDVIEVSEESEFILPDRGFLDLVDNLAGETVFAVCSFVDGRTLSDRRVLLLSGFSGFSVDGTGELVVAVGVRLGVMRMGVGAAGR